MIWLIGITSLWLCVCVLTVSLCAMARRGDEALLLAHARVEDEDEVGFVAGFAEPAPVHEPVRPRQAQRAPR